LQLIAFAPFSFILPRHQPSAMTAKCGWII